VHWAQAGFLRSHWGCKPFGRYSGIWWEATYPFSALAAGDACFGAAGDSNHGVGLCDREFEREEGADSGFFGNGEPFKGVGDCAGSRCGVFRQNVVSQRAGLPNLVNARSIGVSLPGRGRARPKQVSFNAGQSGRLLSTFRSAGRGCHSLQARALNLLPHIPVKKHRYFKAPNAGLGTVGYVACLRVLTTLPEIEPS